MRTLICLVLAGLAGCRGEPTAAPAAPPSAPTSEAKFQHAPAVVAPPSVAPATAAPDPSARLLGRWKPDLADIATDADILRLPKAAQAEAIAAAARILEGVGFEFAADGTATLQDAAAIRRGQYTVEAGADGTAVVRLELAREEEAPRTEVLKVAFEGAALRITTGDGKSSRFVRR